MSSENFFGMTVGVILGLSGGVLAGYLQRAEHQRREEALRAELETVVGDLTALRVMQQWDRFEDARR